MYRINVGAVAREVIDAVNLLPGMVGVIASLNQVSIGEQRGYSGMSAAMLNRELVGRKFDVWRDHMQVNTIRHDQNCKFRGCMLDTDDAATTAEACSTEGCHLEVGLGEAPGDPETRIRHAEALRGDIRFVSAWLGTHLCNGGNHLDKKVAASAIATLRQYGYPIRAHNCDWLDLVELRWLRDQGVDQFNFAPQLGHVITQFYYDKVDASATWCRRTLQDGQYLKWHSDDWTYGGHYTLEQHRRDNWPYAECVQHIRAWLDLRMKVLQ